MDAQYTVLARRFRPQTFSEVVGQERISQTLRNAIQEGRVAHAYLFTGARGVGKTSMARIFSKALNCPHLVDGVPCNECEICKSIAAGQDVDVSEIDGASNRGIDDIRALRANVNIKSMRSKYKIYIIDEVHMLTKEAFNALLKTLEEPPPNVKFIFCTTEPNKLPDTILSRCQRFDFGTVSTPNISLRLKQIAESEGYQVDDDAVALVARRANGSMRDSQSLFDQLLAFGSQHITTEDVHRLLGTAPDDRLVEFFALLIDRDRARLLESVHDALSQGIQADLLVEQMLGYARDLMILACGAAQVPLMSVGEEWREELIAQGQRWGLQTATAAFQILGEAKAKMQRVSYARAIAELALVRISLLQDLSRLDDLIAALQSGAPLPPKPVGSAPPRLPQPARMTLAPAEPTRVTAEPVPDRQAVGLRAEPAADVSTGTSMREAAQGAAIEWRPGNERQILEELATRTGDMTATHLRMAMSIAISGPNLLEIVFPAGYDIGRRSLERPEILSKLENTIENIVGRTVKIRFTQKAEPVNKTEVPAAPPVQTRRIVEESDDAFVQAAAQTFNVPAWKVLELERIQPVVEASDPAPSDADD